MAISRLSKIAGVGLIGFCAVSIAADKADLSPALSQIMGFTGAFLGSLVAGRRRKVDKAGQTPPGPPVSSDAKPS